MAKENKFARKFKQKFIWRHLFIIGFGSNSLKYKFGSFRYTLQIFTKTYNNKGKQIINKNRVMNLILLRSPNKDTQASVAQSAARQSHNLKAVSSSLTGGRILFEGILHILALNFFSNIFRSIFAYFMHGIWEGVSQIITKCFKIHFIRQTTFECIACS